MKHFGTIAVIVLALRLSIGCATIIHGSSQDIHISSAPDQAEVWIDGARMGTTPTQVTLKRKSDYTVVVKKEGFKDVTLKIETQMSAWLIGNIIFGGIPGCVVDLITGGVNDLKPDRLDVNMTKIAQLDGQTILIDRADLDQIKEVRILEASGKCAAAFSVVWAD